MTAQLFAIMENVGGIGPPRGAELGFFLDRQQCLHVATRLPRIDDFCHQPACGKRPHRHRLIHQTAARLAHRTVFGLIPAMRADGGPIVLVRHGCSPVCWFAE